MGPINCSKYMTESDIKLLLTELEKLSTTKEIYVKAYMLTDLLLHTGLRIGETQQLLHCDFYFDTDAPRLHVKNGKGNKERWIPLGSSSLAHSPTRYLLLVLFLTFIVRLT